MMRWRTLAGAVFIVDEGTLRATGCGRRGLGRTDIQIDISKQ
jgi:hypothetical protein